MMKLKDVDQNLILGLEIGAEYIPESLIQIRVNFGPFDDKALRNYLAQVLDALEYLHNNEIEALYTYI